MATAKAAAGILDYPDLSLYTYTDTGRPGGPDGTAAVVAAASGGGLEKGEGGGGGGGG